MVCRADIQTIVVATFDAAQILGTLIHLSDHGLAWTTARYHFSNDLLSGCGAVLFQGGSGPTHLSPDQEFRVARVFRRVELRPRRHKKVHIHHHATLQSHSGRSHGNDHCQARADPRSSSSMCQPRGALAVAFAVRSMLHDAHVT